MDEQNEKKVDDSWKSQVDKERKAAQVNKEAYHEPNFTIFITSLSMQAMIALGKLENPLTNKLDKNYDQARFLIDTLGILKEKTKNNLTPEENNLLEDVLCNLRTVYINEKGKTA